MMNDALPIIFLFRGDAPFFQHALRAALFFNPNNPVILLGTPENAHYQSLGVKYYPLDAFSQDADRFKSLYVHRSHQPYDFKVFNFQRWFMVRDFMRRHSFSRALHLDADVMLYADAAQEGERFRSCGMTLAPWASDLYRCGHTCFINNPEALDLFCDSMMSRFSTSEAIAELDRYFTEESQSDVSDMLMLGLFAQDHPELVAPVSEIVDGCVFDDFLSVLSGFQEESRFLKKGMKRIRFRNGLPYGRHCDYPEPIRFLSIHFHGSLKWLMKYYTPVDPVPVLPGIVWGRLGQLYRKFIGKVY